MTVVDARVCWFVIKSEDPMTGREQRFGLGERKTGDR